VEPVVELPAGTVTLLFTDVEESTRLVRDLGAAYAGVLAEHRRLIRAAVANSGGQVVECRADEFFVVFGDANGAVAAAASAQQALAGHAWPAGASLRVRMGLHTGEPAIEDDSYFGIDVHRAARICSAAHGGQVLLSESTRAIVQDQAPVWAFEDLGEHRLKGLELPERLFQLTLDLPTSSFPPPRTTADETHERKRVVLADDSVLLREGIALLLEDQGFEIVGQSANGDDLLLDVRSYSPDVAIVDIRMPPTHTDEGLRAAQTIRAEHPGVGVLVLSQYAEPAYALELLSETAEGVGYLLKDRISDVKEFAAAVRRVADGGSALDPEVVSQLVGRQRAHDPLEDLSPREREVLGLMAEGRSNQAIAQALFVTERAVEKHVTSIFGKLRIAPSSDDHRRVLAALAFLGS
jgi:DNA-binding NarL/FixJ family response regulator/class 3 adenylate cyclase